MGCDKTAQQATKEAYRISIHAPAWGATFNRVSSGLGDINFNPRTRMGCDAFPPFERVDRVISIHAPAWGATTDQRRERGQPRDFNPRTRMGCDIGVQTASRRSHKFQSTHPHGVRLFYSPDHHDPIPNFNPRTRMGCDDGQKSGGFAPAISIHAPAWGATIITIRALLLCPNFNPRTRMGCD